MIINTIKNGFCLCLLLFVGNFAFGQQTVGVNIYDKEATADGYIFFSPNDYTDAYLIDNCGFLVNSWDRDFEPGLSGHLTESGLMLRTNKVNNAEFFQASTGGNLELVDWDNNTIWSSDFNEYEYMQHHDAVLLPNENVIYIGWERLDGEAQAAYGRDLSNISSPSLWGEYIQEVKPIGNSNYEIVWEWHLKDHFVQDYNSSLSNYGIIKNEIGKVDINYLGPAHFSDRDWWHCNALDYNPALDQIMVNSRSNSETWIIDHSTTTAEAAGSTGGNSQKGGELMFRWGNPKAYERGFTSDIRMYGSHGHYWIPEGYPNAGKIMYFNNGDQRPEGYYSTVEIIDPQFENGEYLKNSNNRYFPLEPEIVYKAPNPFDFKSTFLSNAKQLKNGNVFINEGGRGRLFEIDSNDNIVWQYISPIDSNGPNTQGGSIDWWDTDIFRAYKYEPDYLGFSGRDLTPGELLEGDSEYNLCKSVATDDQVSIDGLDLIYDLNSSRLIINNKNGSPLDLKVMSIDGKNVIQKQITGIKTEESLSDLEKGIYVVVVSTLDGSNIISKKIVRF